MELVLLIALILCNGLFAMAEIALVTARKSRLQRLADEGDRAAAVAVRLGREPTQFLSTVQIGITAIGLLNGIVGEAVLAGPLAGLLREAGLTPGASAIAATVMVVAGITYVSIVVGELVPKRLAQFNAEGIARRVARPVSWLAQLSRPFVWLLSVSTDGLLRLLGQQAPGGSHLTEEDIDAMLVEGSLSGVIEPYEHDMVRKIFRLDDRRILSLMTPRSDIVFLDIDHPRELMLARVNDSEHSCFPVCRGGIQEVLGVVTAKQLLRQQLSASPPALDELLQPAVFVPESQSGMQLLAQFRRSGIRMVFVVDEYGDVLGLVTQQDLLEALAGEFHSPEPGELWAVQRADGSWLLDGLLPVHELQDRLGLKRLPGDGRGRYHTLGGMLLWLWGRMPGTGEHLDWEGWRLEVVDLDGNRIDKVLASPLADADGQAPAGDESP